MSTSAQTLVCGLTGFVISWVLIRLILSRRIWFAAGAGERQLHQTHTTPIPRIGGLAFVVVFLVVGALILLWLPHRRTDPTAWAAFGGWSTGVWRDGAPPRSWGRG